MKFLEQLKESLQNLWLDIAASAPKIIGVLVLIIIFLIIVKIISSVLKKVLLKANVNKLGDKLNQIELSEGKTLNINLVNILVKTIKWLLYIVLISIVADILELTMVSEGLKSFMGYLPKLFTALAIVTLGLLFATFVKKSLQSLFESLELSGGKLLSQLVFLLLMVLISVTALNQAEINTEIITSNIKMILAAFLLAFALAFGLGARNVIEKVLHTFYTRKLYEVGKVIEFNGIRGEVESINSISVTIKTEEGKLIVPIKDIVESQVKIQD
ncbi:MULTISPECIES: mechanosensitive ion channel family protein [Hwangdonia]|uniref:Mechanosensitive ion channel domain-containing protein n=1 Tax=Hwangdonia seohaensis TaxID=1240727 RepID=A0ABW3RB76_9FLAO|nr:mechanosensitive ion channel domain-containing protein [Hwangdonia seohaensis]